MYIMIVGKRQSSLSERRTETQLNAGWREVFVDLREVQDPKLSRNIGEGRCGYLEATAQYAG